MRTTTTILAAVLMLAAAVQADVFNLGGVSDPLTGAWTGVASLETVPVGDPANTADSAMHSGMPGSQGAGAVGYVFNIGKYEVTAGQYTAFLNAVAKTDTYGLYNPNMADPVTQTYWGCNIQRSGLAGSYVYSVAPDWANRPVNHVSWGDAARFANWLTNGQPTGSQGPGTTETGVYSINGATTDAALLAVKTPDVGTRTAWANGTTSFWLLPTENEWYKAAYYKAGSTNAGYWNYPTANNAAPGFSMADASGNNANYGDFTSPPLDSGKYTTVVGEFQNSVSPYGTFDQGGNVCEWNETAISATYRGQRGGSAHLNYGYALASNRYSERPGFRGYNSGFRIVQVPEPATLFLLAVGGLAMMRKRRR